MLKVHVKIKTIFCINFTIKVVNFPESSVIVQLAPNNSWIEKLKIHIYSIMDHYMFLIFNYSELIDDEI